HRDVEPTEDVGMLGERLREDHPRLDVSLHLGHDWRQTLVRGLLVEDRERADDADAGFDQGCELPGEDLERLRVDLLEHAATWRGGTALRLGEALRQEAPLAKLFLRGVEVGS